jgi:dephospho-CoA kinase
MGAGKSAALAFLRRWRGVAVLSTDAVGRRLLKTAPVVRRLRGTFGSGILSGRRIDRRRLAAAAFAGAAGVARLNRVLHPAIRASVARWIRRQRALGVPLAVVETPLLFEGRFEDLFDGVLSVSAPAALRRARVGRARFAQRSRFQWSQDRKDARADWVMRNVSTRGALRRALRDWAKERMGRNP